MIKSLHWPGSLCFQQGLKTGAVCFPGLNGSVWHVWPIKISKVLPQWAVDMVALLLYNKAELSWTTLNGQYALCCSKNASFGAHCTNLNEDRSIPSAAKMCSNDSSFWKYKVHTAIRGGSFGRGHQMTVALSSTVIFGNLGRYFLGNFRDKASSIIWWHAILCWPVTERKRNVLEWPWVAI